MKKLLTFIVVVVMTFGCSMRPASHFDVESRFPDLKTDTSAIPQLTLQAHPRVGFAPLRVSVRAQLENVIQTDSFFGCLWQSWNFGDGAVSSQKSDCGGAQAETSFNEEHIYRKPGTYVVQFVLGDTQVLSNPVSIRVIGSDEP
jgi:PKD domain-containing protein